MHIKIPTLDKLYSLRQDLFTKLGVDRPLGFLISRGLTANKITVISQTIGLLSIVYLFKNPAVFSALYLSNKFLDILDGYVAKRFNLQSELGDKLDHWGDLTISIGLLLSTILFSDLKILAMVAIVTYLSEYIILKKQGLLRKRFPSAIFGLFFVFGFYKVGLIYQIAYQIISHIFFQAIIRGQKSKNL